MPLEIAVMCTVGPYRISQFLLDYLSTNQHVEVTLHDVPATRIVDDLLSGRVDLAILGAPVSEPLRLRHTKLYTEDMVLACNAEHPFANRPKIRLEDLSSQPYLDRLHCEFRNTFMTTVARENITLRTAVRSEREDWIQHLVKTGQGVTILPCDSVVSKGIATVPLDRGDLKRNVLLAVATGREDNEAVRAFVTRARKFDWIGQGAVANAP